MYTGIPLLLQSKFGGDMDEENIASAEKVTKLESL